MKSVLHTDESRPVQDVDKRFRRAYEHAAIGMALLDREAAIIDANPAFTDVFLPPEGESTGTSFASLVSKDDCERFVSAYQLLVENGISKVDEKLVCVNADEMPLQTLVNISNVRSQSGDFLFAVAQVQDITEATNLTVQLEYQASYDELTGLLNRRAFEVELQRAWENGKRGGGSCHLLFMDLDQFKVVNDTSGHHAGDQLLRAIGDILIDSVRSNDTVARQGGDEFAILLWDCPAKKAEEIAESLRASIEKFRFHWGTETYRIGVSIGGIPIDPKVGDISEIRQLADAACYTAKEAGRNQVHMVHGKRDSALKHRGQVRWVQRLRQAMNNNRFAIYGQKIAQLDDGAIEPERIEILLRLRDPATRKMIPPGAFLPAAERYGLSVELDMWVVSNLLHTLFIYQAFQAADRQYWINLSGSSICDPRFAAFLKDAIVQSPLPPETINFEINETAVIRSIADAGRLMSDLQEMGCRFALDDFGSGVSSYNVLKSLPIDYIKIDGTYIREILRDETDRIFVKSIIDIGRSLDIKVIAECVENDQMLEQVRLLGADYAQGFAIGRPFILAPSFPGVKEIDRTPVPATINAN